MKDKEPSTHYEKLKQEKLDRNAELEKKALADLHQFNQCVENVAATEDGKTLLSWLMKHCGYQNYILSADPQTQEINTQTSLHQASMVGVWIRLRRHIPRHLRIEIEDPEEKVAPTGDVQHVR